MKTFRDLIPGDRVFSFNKDAREIFIDELIDNIWFDKDFVRLKLTPILNADEWYTEFIGVIEKKYLNQSWINSENAFISPNEELFFNYINEII